MGKHKKHIFILLTAILTVSLLVFLVPKFKTQAAKFGGMYIFLSRIKANLTGAAGQEVEMILAFKTGSSFNDGGELTLYFSDPEDTKWCRTAGSLTVTGVTSAGPDLSGTIDISDPLPVEGGQTLSATCSQGSGTMSFDQVTISNIGALASGTVYGVKISSGSGAGAGVLGTGTNPGLHTFTVQLISGAAFDYGTFKQTLIAEDTVKVTSSVVEIPTVTCQLAGTSVSLAALYPGGAMETKGPGSANGATTLTTNTNNATGNTNGYYWAVYGKGDGTTAGLKKTTASPDYVIASPATSVNLASPSAVGGFGLRASDPTNTGGTVRPDFSSATTTVFGGIGSGPSNAKLLLYKTSAQTTQSVSNITYGAKAEPAAPAGEYEEYVTYVCGAYF